MKGLIPTPTELEAIQSLYDRSLYLQAYRAAEALAPLADWRGPEARVLAGRVLNNSGQGRLGKVLHDLAWRESRSAFTALFRSHGLLATRGPLAALEHLKPWCESDVGEPNLHAHLFASRAHAAAIFRDFGCATQWIQRADEILPDDAWVYVEWSDCLQCQDRYDEALEMARRALEVKPWYRPAVQQSGHLLRLLDRAQEAVALLEEATTRLESGAVVAQLATLHEELGNFATAKSWFEKLTELWPVREKPVEKWLSATRANLAYRTGDSSAAIEHAVAVDDPFHKGFAERLRGGLEKSKRVQLDVPFVRQHHMTCAPATLSAVSRFWKAPVAHLDLAEAICYDGTPAHSERLWAQSHGWRVREFTVTIADAEALLDRGIPFTLTTTETASAHLQAVIGYDSMREALLVRDPFLYDLREFNAPALLERYRANGPRGMALVPEAEAARLEGLDLTDAGLYDGFHQVMVALDGHDRPRAEEALNALVLAAPQHRITLQARHAMAAYDQNMPAVARVIEELRAQFPADGHLLLLHLGCVKQLATRSEALALLRETCAQPKADPNFLLRLASELREEARGLPEAEWFVRRAMRRSPVDAHALALLGEIVEMRGAPERATELYRLAACAGDMNENFAQGYFDASRRVRGVEDALAFLRARLTQLGKKSAQPGLTLFRALHRLDRTKEAFEILSEQLTAHSNDPALLLFAADAHARFGEFVESNELLRRAEKVNRRETWLRTNARLHSYRGESREALESWREVLEREPLAFDAHSSVAHLTAAIEGRDAAIAQLSRACERFPQNFALRRLLTEWLRESSAIEHEAAARRLTELNSTDVWANRELAGALIRQGKAAEALAAATAAIELAPVDSWSFSCRADLHRLCGRTAEAKHDYERAIRLSVDNDGAIAGLMHGCETLEERKAAVAFIEEELKSQVVFGNGLHAFHRAASGVLAPADLERALRAAHKAKPDLPSAWSALVRHLIDVRRNDDALAFARDATQRFPLTLDTWLDLGLVERARVDSTGEAAAIDHALLIEPGNGGAARLRSALHARLGDFENARAQLEQACSLAPLDAFNHGWLAEMLWKLDRREEALEKLRRALQLEQNYDWAWSALAQWAAVLQQPDLPRQMAKELIERFPGEAQPWVIYARLMKTGTESKEKLEALEKALALNPRHVGAHWSKAQMFAALGRFDEAIAACSPEAWAGQKVPQDLRYCAAQIEAQRRNLRRAVELAQDVLADSPAYYDGWEALAGWLWDLGERDKAVAAAERMGQLAPLSPVPFGFVGSMKLQMGKRADAKADLRHGFDLDPHYEFGGFRLFDLQLEDKEFPSAAETLARLEKHIGGPATLLRAVQLGRRYLESGDPVAAFLRFGKLKGDIRGCFMNALDALHGSRFIGDATRGLDEAVKDKENNPAVGYVWMQRRIRLGSFRFPSKPAKFFGGEEIAREAAIGYLHAIAPGAQGRRIRRFVSRHGAWLRRETDSWGAVGYALVATSDYRRCVAWMADWRTRPGVEPWMLANLSHAYRARGKYAAAHEITTFALRMPRQDNTHLKLRLWYVFEEALAGHTAAADTNLTELRSNQFADVDQKLVFALAEGTVAVQLAPTEKRRAVFRVVRGRIRNALGNVRLGKLKAPERRLYRRGVNRMSKDAGNRWPYYRAWLKTTGFPVGLVSTALVIVAVITGIAILSVSTSGPSGTSSGNGGFGATGASVMPIVWLVVFALRSVGKKR